MEGSDGNLYGTTSGGANMDGSIYQLTPSGTFTTIYSFTGNSDGYYPACQLVVGSDGILYGTTSGASSIGAGTVFRVTSSGNLTTLHTFATMDGNGINIDGGEPQQGLTLASDSNLYGITSRGGAHNSGTIFQITPSGQFELLYTFSAQDDNGDNDDGAGAFSNTLAEGPNGALYGLSFNGGASNDGTVYKLTIPGLLDSRDRFDFNRDGHSDLIWYNTGTGGVSVWDMDDQSVLSYGATFTQLAPSSGWVPVCTPDINADGYPDLLWWNKNTGELSFWTLHDTTVLHYYGDFATVSDTDWKPVAAADVTGTTWELVFQNTATGALSAWDMNGQTVTSYGATLATLGAGTPYQVVGAHDIDADGKSDLLFWDSQTGGVSYWSCNLAASQVLGYHGDFTSLSDTSWHLVGSEDTNGDGHSDLLWWNASTGEVSRWLLSGTTVTNYGGDSAKVPDTTWQPTAIR